MLYYHGIDLSKRIDLLKIIKNLWFAAIASLIMVSNFNIIYAMVVMISQCCVNISDIAIMTIENVDYRCIVHIIRKFEAISSLKVLCLKIVRIYQKHCLNFWSSQSNFFLAFLFLFYKRWLMVNIVCISVALECYKTQNNNLYSCWYSSFYNPIYSCMG